MRKAAAAITLAAIASSIVLTHTTEASAQANVHYVTPTGKGITGCALLGAETVALIEAAAGLRARWAYIVFPLLGAGAGAAGGYFLESAGNGGADTTLTGISVGTLVLGLGLVVPTVIAYVNATSYHPESETAATEDNAPTNAPIDESTSPPGAGGTTAPAAAPPAGGTTGGGSGGGATAPATGGTTSSVHQAGNGRRVASAPALRPTGLVDFTHQGMSLAVPAFSVENSISLHDMRQYGLAPQAEFRVPVISGSF